MTDEHFLTMEVAGQFIEDSDAMDLSTFTAIADNAASLLANFKSEVSGPDLFLDGLKSLSASSATALALHGGDLSLRGV